MKQKVDFPIKENPCPDCGSTNLEARQVSAPGWRGWSVKCLDCDLVIEYDEPEAPEDHRGV